MKCSKFTFYSYLQFCENEKPSDFRYNILLGTLGTNCGNESIAVIRIFAEQLRNKNLKRHGAVSHAITETAQWIGCAPGSVVEILNACFNFYQEQEEFYGN